ncbi:hypothetical protein SAMN03159341_10492 [Paenibacillus sp. 1_12]|uniref:WYL domain-containing protein n=1 Tax=Paenibacillus sp. 1_12 TaxID=1566278 RepID=UPI0008F2E9EA|nr:WYL domain-containing protein [Paenibacillus sp. 1_12]SFL22168.1 hypothetical protein SAMN03159341_10492 [Paenibacillus sp. 1_12]
MSVTTHYSSTEKAIQNILSNSSHVKIIEPPDLIAELQGHIMNMAQIYKID